MRVEHGPEAAAAAARARNAYDALEGTLGDLDDLAASPSPVAPRRLVVVGGGIVGLMSALFASLSGYRVTVLERLSFGGAASGRNAGGILALGHSLGELPFNRFSVRLWRDLARSGVEGRYRASGHAMVAFSEEEAAALDEAASLYSQAGLDAGFVGPDRLARLLPGTSGRNHGALVCPTDAQGYPFDAVTSLVARLRERGADLRPNTVVTGFVTDRDEVRAARTDRGDVPADAFLLCTGPWTAAVGELLGARLAVAPRRSQIVATQRVRERVVDPFVTGNSLYLRQTHAGNLLFGGGGAWESRSFDVTNVPSTVSTLVKRFLELFPAFRDLQLIRAFAGTVELTPDFRPLLGAVGAFGNAFVAAGFNGHGFGWSAAAGRLAAAVVADADGRRPLPADVRELLVPLAPSRHELAAGSGPAREGRGVRS